MQELHHNIDTLGLHGYSIENTKTGKQVSDICAKFIYKGFDIRFSTFEHHNESYPDPTRGAVAFNDDPIHAEINGKLFNTVEDVIKAVDESLKKAYLKKA